jgi:hypothetical protein
MKKWDGWAKVANCENMCVRAYCFSLLEPQQCLDQAQIPPCNANTRPLIGGASKCTSIL